MRRKLTNERAANVVIGLHTDKHKVQHTASRCKKNERSKNQQNSDIPAATRTLITPIFPIAARTPPTSNDNDKPAVDTGASNAATTATPPAAATGIAGTTNARKPTNNSVYNVTHAASEASDWTARTRAKADAAWARMSFNRPRWSTNGSCLA